MQIIYTSGNYKSRKIDRSDCFRSCTRAVADRSVELHGKDYRCRILCYRDYFFSGIHAGSG